jgi:hypothetical protein
MVLRVARCYLAQVGGQVGNQVGLFLLVQAAIELASLAEVQRFGNASLLGAASQRQLAVRALASCCSGPWRLGS